MLGGEAKRQDEEIRNERAGEMKTKREERRKYEKQKCGDDCKEFTIDRALYTNMDKTLQPV